MHKSISIALLTTAIISGFVLVSFLHFRTVNASTENSSMLTPLVPEFALKYIDLSYDVPPTYGIDQFTGENVIVEEGRHVDNKSVAFKIENQPFTSYNDSSGNFISLYYNFRFKGHFGDEWKYYPFSESGGSTHRYSISFYWVSDLSPKLNASDSEYTDIFLGLPFLFGVFNPSVGSQVDFQVQALIGYIDYAGDGFYRYSGQRSDWSSTQTVTVGENQITPTPTPTPIPTPTTLPTPTPTIQPSPTIPEFSTTIALVSVIVIGTGLLVYFRKHKK